MFKPIPVLAASAIALFGASSLAGGAEVAAVPSHNAVTVVAVLGPSVAVPAGQFRRAYAFCPSGYYVTGGGVYNGAITEIASSPTPNLRGWFVDGMNTDPAKRTFHHRVAAVCVKGSPTVPIRAASDGTPLRQTELEFATSRDASAVR
jgi:hypothetical protein